MTQTDVEQNIGKADSVSNDGRIWYYGNKWNFVYFKDGIAEGVNIDMTNGRIAEALERQEVAYDLNINPSLESATGSRIPIVVNGKPVDYIEQFHLKLEPDGRLFLTALSEKRIFRMYAVLSKNKIEDHSVTLDKPLLGGNGFSIFQKGFKLSLSSNEFIQHKKITIDYKFEENFGLGVTDEPVLAISASGILSAVVESDELQLNNNPASSSEQTYQKTSFKTFDFFGQLDNCDLKLLEFTDIYERQSLTGAYDTIAIVRLLKKRGLSMVAWSHGRQKNGTLITCVSYADAKFDCGCHIDKLYKPTEKEGEYIVTERINCFPRTWLTAMTSISHTE